VGRRLSPARHLVLMEHGGPLGPAYPGVEKREAGMPFRLHPPHFGGEKVGNHLHLRLPHLRGEETVISLRLHLRLLGAGETEILLRLCPAHHGGEETVIPFRLHHRRSARHALAWRCRRDAPAEEGSIRGFETPSPCWLCHGSPVTGCRRPGHRSPSLQWCSWREDTVLLRKQSILKDNRNRTGTPKGMTKHSRKTTERTDTGSTRLIRKSQTPYPPLIHQMYWFLPEKPMGHRPVRNSSTGCGATQRRGNTNPWITGRGAH